MPAWKEVCAWELFCQPPVKTSETHAPLSTLRHQTEGVERSQLLPDFHPAARAGNLGPANLSPSHLFPSFLPWVVFAPIARATFPKHPTRQISGPRASTGRDAPAASTAISLTAPLPSNPTVAAMTTPTPLPSLTMRSRTPLPRVPSAELPGAATPVAHDPARPVL